MFKADPRQIKIPQDRHPSMYSGADVGDLLIISTNLRVW